MEARKKGSKKLLYVVLLFLFVAPALVAASQVTYFDTQGLTLSNCNPQAKAGIRFWFTALKPINLTGLYTYNSTLRGVYIYATDPGVQATACTTTGAIAKGNFSATQIALLNQSVSYAKGAQIFGCFEMNQNDYGCYGNSNDFPKVGNTTYIAYNATAPISGGYDGYDRFIGGVYFNISVFDNTSFLTLQANNAINGSAISGLCANITSTNTTNSSYVLCNQTGTTVATNLAFIDGNITIYSLGNGSPNGNSSYFNVTFTDINFNASMVLTGQTFQSILNISAYDTAGQPVKNFTITNGLITNTTNSYSLTIPANSVNNILAQGNETYPLNVTVNSTPLTTSYFNVTRLVHSVVTIGLRNNFTQQPVTTFSGWSAGAFGDNTTFNTTNGTAYLYEQYGTHLVFITAAGYSITSSNFLTTTFNASAHSLNFSLYTNNSVGVNVYRQDTGALLTSNTTVQIVGTQASKTNYTTTGSTYFENLPDDIYSLTVSAVNYSTSYYAVTVANSNTQIVNAYLTGSNNTVTFTVSDNENGVLLQNVNINSYRYVNNSLVLVESHLTDLTGRATFTILPTTYYQFVVSATGYKTSSFTLNPVLFSSYDVKIQKTAQATPVSDYTGVSVYYTPSSFYSNQTNSFTFTIYSATGNLTQYNMSLVYPSGSYFNSSTLASNCDARGCVFTTTFNLQGANLTDTANLTYCYTTVNLVPVCFSYPLPILGLYKLGTWAAFQTGNNYYGLGIFERVLLMVILTTIVGGIVTMIAGGLAGGMVAMLVLGFFTLTGFVPVWITAISMFMLFIIIARGGN